MRRGARCWTGFTRGADQTLNETLRRASLATRGRRSQGTTGHSLKRPQPRRYAPGMAARSCALHQPRPDPSDPGEAVDQEARAGNSRSAQRGGETAAARSVMSKRAGGRSSSAGNFRPAIVYTIYIAATRREGVAGADDGRRSANISPASRSGPICRNRRRRFIARAPRRLRAHIQRRGGPEVRSAEEADCRHLERQPGRRWWKSSGRRSMT